MRTRVKSKYLDELIENEGELQSGPINTMGILRLALDLRDAREKVQQLEKQLQQEVEAR